MKKSLLNSSTINELIGRAEKLHPDSKNKWGKMSVAEMLLHCTLANTFILEDTAVYKKPTLKQRIIKLVVIHVISQIPKNNKGPARLETKGRINDKDFEDQRQKYIEVLKKFPTHNKPFTSLHAKAGYLTTKEWGVFAWMHNDHHLRQFGV